MAKRNCQLEHAAGRTAACPGETCGLWHDGGCVIAPLSADLERNPALVQLLTDVRHALEQHDPQHALRAFHPPGLV